MKMAEVYVRLIKAGKKSIDEIPETLKEEVQSILDNGSNDSTNVNQ